MVSATALPFARGRAGWVLEERFDLRERGGGVLSGIAVVGKYSVGLSSSALTGPLVGALQGSELAAPVALNQRVLRQSPRITRADRLPESRGSCVS